MSRKSYYFFIGGEPLWGWSREFEFLGSVFSVHTFSCEIGVSSVV